MKVQIRLSLLSLVGILASAGTAHAAKYDDIKAEIAKIVADNPAIARQIELGANDQNNIIYGLRLESATAPAAGETRPTQLLVAVHHGNERDSATVAMSFARRTVAALKNAADPASAGLSKQVFYVIPVLNIGGYNANRRTETNAAGRVIDPNRDYPDPCLTEKTNYQLKSTKLLSDFMVKENVSAAITIHGYIGTFTYPWGIFTDQTHTPDDATYDMLGHRAVLANGYRTGTHTDVIYPTAGAFEDWSYHAHGIWTMLLEVDNNLSVSDDTEALVTFYSLVPRTRSQAHAHLGHCTDAKLDDLLRARP